MDLIYRFSLVRMAKKKWYIGFKKVNLEYSLKGKPHKCKKIEMVCISSESNR